MTVLCISMALLFQILSASSSSGVRCKRHAAHRQLDLISWVHSWRMFPLSMTDAHLPTFHSLRWYIGVRYIPRSPRNAHRDTQFQRLHQLSQATSAVYLLTSSTDRSSLVPLMKVIDGKFPRHFVAESIRLDMQHEKQRSASVEH